LGEDALSWAHTEQRRAILWLRADGPHSFTHARGAMKLVVVPIAGLVLFLGLAKAPAADDKIVESPWYPLKIGTKWHYKVGANKFSMHVTKHEKVGDAVCGLVETSKDGNVVTSEQVGVKDDGVYRYSIAGQKPDVPFRILKLPPKNGDTWKVETKIAGQGFNGSFKLNEEDVTVPAGKYKTMHALSDGFAVPGDDGGKIKIVFQFWFAEKVGLVKQTIQFGERPELVIELEKFEAP
jgi:hypothetical protein